MTTNCTDIGAQAEEMKSGCGNNSPHWVITAKVDSKKILEMVLNEEMHILPVVWNAGHDHNYRLNVSPHHFRDSASNQLCWKASTQGSPCLIK